MKIRAVIWCAVSTRSQVSADAESSDLRIKDSLPTQEANARALCEREGWQIVDVLRVPGHSRNYVDIHDVARDMAAQGINAFYSLLDLWTTKAFDVLICLDGSRFARTQSLHAYVVERTIGIGARIYSLADGWIDEQNYRMFISMSGYSSASEVDKLKARFQMGMNTRAREGRPVGSRVIYSHVLVRDPRTGQALRLELDPTKARLWEDLATLILEGISWTNMERELFARFGHINPKTGKPFQETIMYQRVYSPTFWGHTARHFSTREAAWVYDDMAPIPPGITIYRNTHPAVWAGDLAERIKAELHRREDVIRGRARPTHTYPFTGLLMCASCKHLLAVSPHNRANGKHDYNWRCVSRNRKRNPKPCSEHKGINDKEVIRGLTNLFRELKRAGNLDRLTLPQAIDALNRVQALEKEVNELQREIGNMITSQAKATTESVKTLYEQKIQIAGERLDILKQNINQARSAAESPNQAVLRQRALDELFEIGLEEFWKQSPTHVNQILHRVFGKLRMVVQEGRIIGLDHSIGHRPKPLLGTKPKQKYKE